MVDKSSYLCYSNASEKASDALEYKTRVLYLKGECTFYYMINIKSTIYLMMERFTLGFLVTSLVLAAVPRVDNVYAETVPVAEVQAAVVAEPVVEAPVVEVIPEPVTRYAVTVVATAYSSDPWQTDSTPCTPAMHKFDLCKAYEENGTEDTIAANFLPLGTKVRFPDVYGDKVFVVRDRMNAKYNGQHRIDFWIGSATPTNQEIIREAKQKAVAFGVKRMKMEILK